MYADSQAEAVEQRHGGKHLVTRAEHRVRGNDLLAQRIKIQIGEQDALVVPVVPPE